MAAKRKKSSLATITKRVATRKRSAKKKNSPAKKPSAKRKPPAKKADQAIANPPYLEDITDVVLPGIGAYASSRIIGRVAYKLARKKSPTMAKHAGALAPAGFLLLLWFLVHKVQRLEKYHGPALIGSSIGAIQALLQTYLPTYGWILNDYHLDDVLPKSSNGKDLPAPTAASGTIEIGGDEFSALESGYSDDDLAMADMESFSDLYSGSLSGGLGGLGG